MAMIPLAIRAHFKDSVTVKTLVTVDAEGTKILSAASDPILGRLDYGERRMTSVTGEQIVTTIQLYMPDFPGLTVEGEVTLPAGTAPRIKALSRRRWPSGAISMEIGF